MRVSAMLAAAGVAGVFGLFANNAGAAVVAQYTFERPAGVTLMNSSDADATSVASDIAFGAGATDNGATVGGSGSRGNPVSSAFFGLNADASPVGGLNQTTQAGAESNGDYLTFTLTPDPSAALNMTKVTFEAVRENVTGTSTTGAPDQWYLSANGTVVGSGTINSVWTDPANPGTIGSVNGSAAWHWISSTADLSGVPAVQNISSATTFHLGFYGLDTQTNLLRIDNISLEGAAVPEPTSLAVLGLAAMGLLARRRNAR